MNKLYLIILFTAFSFLASAQDEKGGDVTYASDAVKVKVVKLYPNPAVDVINFELIRPVTNDVVLQIYSFTGKKVYQSPALSQKTTIPLTEFFRGVYIFQLRDKYGRIIESGKFQVNK